MTRPQKLTCDDARQWLAQDDAPTIIDVRTPAEFGSDHLQGAINVPLDLVEKNPQQIADAIDGEVLLVCRTDNRAGQAARLLAPTLGARVHVLTGGMSGWSEKGGPVESGEGGAWAMDRQVRTTAGALALTGIVASTVAPKAKWLAGGIGAGLLYSGLSDSCAMAEVLDKMPWNRVDSTPTLESATAALRSGRSATACSVRA